MSEQKISLARGIVEKTGLSRISMLSGDQLGREYLLENAVTKVGRALNNDIVIADPQASRRHFEIIQVDEGYRAVDTGSFNGFYLNDTLVKETLLHHGDILTIGLVQMAFIEPGNPSLEIEKPRSLRPLNPPKTVLIRPDQYPEINQPFPSPFPPLPPGLNAPEMVDLRPRPDTTVGREPGTNDVALDNPQVSRRHFYISNREGAFKIGDLRSTNGTFVNSLNLGEETHTLNDGDIIAAGPFRFMFTSGCLYLAQDDESVRVDVLNLSKEVGRKIPVLQNVTLTILPREFVAIVGGSGAGKTTLLDAISGVRPATSGTVLYNQSDYYSRMEAYRPAIGYVPQEDIVPTELTVRKALFYAARLRLPPETSNKEIHNRLEEVMEDLGLNNQRDIHIRNLSGGQRKRVSIGAELISKPSLFFLDEPTSGLDPGLEGRMMQLLRKLADQGRTVILITHATQNVELCDRVLFLARTGQMAFYGSPAEALTYFGVTKFSDIYIKLDNEKSPQEWAVSFLSSASFLKNVAARLKVVAYQAGQNGIILEGAPKANLTSPPPDRGPMVTFTRPRVRVSRAHQFKLLVSRYSETLLNDRKYLGILLLQAPLIALMMLIVFNKGDFANPGGDFGKAKTLIFLLVVVAVWFGTSNSAREIVKESAIYRRESKIGLKLSPYIFSKFMVQGFLILVQVSILVLILWGGIGLNTGSPESLFYIFFTLFLSALSGVTLGLLISSLTTNSDRATSFVPIALIPQIIFGGAVVPLNKLGPVGEFISQFIVAKWGYRATGALTGLDSIPSPRLKFYGPPPEQALNLERLFKGSIKYEAPDWFLFPTRDPEFNINVTAQWGILILIIVITLGMIFFFQSKKDQTN